MLKDYQDVLCEKLPEGLPPSRDVDHKIELVPNAKIVKSNAYHVQGAALNALKKHIDTLLELGFIRRSDSPWSSPVHLVPKKGDDSANGY